MGEFNHKHYPGFNIDKVALEAHLIYDHSQTREEVDSFEDVEAWHTAQHPEIGAEPGSLEEPDLEVLSQQLIELQDVVDQLILNDLLDL